MTSTSPPPYELSLIEDVAALGRILERASKAEAIALDVEANGLFVYRPRLCAVQIAWDEGGATRVAVVDTLAMGASELAPLFGSEGPIKVLHDLTFDARMLAESGAPIGRARDTSVAARLLGQTSTGLSSVLAAELGISLDKRFQQHDWSRRPFARDQLRYLGDDVAYLVALDRALSSKASAIDIEAEIAEECAYKLEAALAPPRDGRPAYVRIKGAQKLDREGRAVLRRLVAARESIAEAADVPPFKIVTNEILLELSMTRPTTIAALGRIRGALSGRAGKHAGTWLEAITRGIADGDIPAEEAALFEPVVMNRREVARRREIEARVSGFRRAEAKRRGVDEQVVLPGHCAQAVASLLAGAPPGEGVDPARIAAIPGFGEKRASLYAARLASLLVAKAEAPSSSDKPEDTGKA